MVVGWFGRARRRGLRPTSVDAGPLGLASLSTAELCGLWRKSRSGLSGAATPGAVARVAAARGAILDELERREPEVMAEWLGSGALEPDGPSAYLVR